MIEEQSSYFHAKKKISLKRAYKPDLLVEDLVKRRKSEMEDDQCAAMENQHRENLGRACSNEVDAIASNVLSRREERTVKNNNTSFSIGRALAGFIDLNCKRANLNKCKDASRETIEKDQKPSSIEQTKSEDMSYDSYHISIPCPDIPASSSQDCFILSSTIFEQRRLVRHIRKYLPHAQLIERVFNFGLDLSKEQDKKKRSNIAGEADILISPTTGLILTTLQRIKQRALPGQTRTSPMKERLKVLAEKYEEIILLVSKTDVSDVNVENLCLLDDSDCEALADIQGFATQLKCNLKVNYVLCGRVELINWTIAIMRKYSVESEISKNVLEDESLWEMFLRHAGFNAFAAQIVLGHLKSPVDAKSSENGAELTQKPFRANLTEAVKRPFGLSALIKMTSEERVKCLGPLVDSKRIVQQFNDLLDTSWVDMFKLRVER